MENLNLRKQYNIALESMVSKFKKDSKCLAIFLVGSMSHDKIWEWSDLELLSIYDDSYKGPSSFNLLENNIHVVVNIRKRSAFRDYLGSTNISDYFFCALSKSTILFTKDITLQDLFEDIFYLGDKDKEIEMLLGFSEAVYFYNKAEKNFRVKENSENAVYFLFNFALGVAWLEVAKEKMIPEREIIAQASKLKPDLFKVIYHDLFNEKVTDERIDRILKTCYAYLVEKTLEVYNPIISYLKENGSLKDFSLKTRPHGFGINYEWLFRVGIVERYVEPVKINHQNTEFLQIGYRLKD